MVAYAIEAKPAVGCICPKCFRELMGPTVAGERDRYGRIIRSYFGWCVSCDVGFEVVQFKQENTKFGWLINRYRLFKKLEGSEKPQPVTAWLTINELPQPAPVITGPGGQYDKPFEPETINLIETLLNALKATTRTVESLLKLAKPK